MTVSLFPPLIVQHYGYTKITANSTTLVWEFVRDEDNETFDKVILTNSYVNKGRQINDQVPAENEDEFEPFLDPSEL